MRRAPALIVGGGPAGAAAAIRLAQGGLRPLLIERNAAPRDVVCGGFLGWDSLAALRRLGIDPAALGARPITRLRLVSTRRSVEVRLPHAAAGLSRRTLDEALLGAAAEAGADVMRGRSVRGADGLSVRMEEGEEIEAEALLLATGKPELRGAERDAGIADAPLGLRTALRPQPALLRALEGWIELHLFDDGYAGLLVQDDGAVNLCLSASRARLKGAGGIEPLIAELATALPAFGARLDAGEAGSWSAVAGVPYGWRARDTMPGLYRIGDQAAVIASLAGDGIAIALESGQQAAGALLAGCPAPQWQRAFARHSRRPIGVAELLRRAAENRRTRNALLPLLQFSPGLAATGARLTRIVG